MKQINWYAMDADLRAKNEKPLSFKNRQLYRKYRRIAIAGLTIIIIVIGVWYVL